MVEITREKAKQLFDLRLQVFALPSLIDVNHETFHKLSIHKNYFCPVFPDKRLKEYAEVYCNEQNGNTLKFFFNSPVVLISRSGSGFIIKAADTKQQLFIVRGSDKKLVQFVNSHFLSVANSGYLEPQFSSKIKYKVSLTPRA